MNTRRVRVGLLVELVVIIVCSFMLSSLHPWVKNNPAAGVRLRTGDRSAKGGFQGPPLLDLLQNRILREFVVPPRTPCTNWSRFVRG